MIKFNVYDSITNEQIQTIFMVNAEFYIGLLCGIIMASIFWNQIKGAE